MKKGEEKGREKEREREKKGGKRWLVKGKYPWTPREATPAELLAAVAGGLLTSRAINIFIRRFHSADRLGAPHARRYRGRHGTASFHLRN